MKLIGYVDGRTAGTVCTDMDITEFYDYYYINVLGHAFAITSVIEISEAEARKWKSVGYPTTTKQEVRLRAIGL